MIEIDGKKIYFVDLHLHSRFSRACSKDLNLGTLEKWGRVKGLDVIGTGDFTHEGWLTELKESLIEKEGIFYSKSGFKFILTGAISLIYTRGRGRRVHLVLLAPSFETVDKINLWLDTKGRRDYDGRPIFKISCEDFAAKMFAIDEKIEVIPAHVWTPYFGVFGSKSGFDSLKEAFGPQLDKVHAIETGISSTPAMNLKLRELQDKTIVSFSDSHSFWPWRLGRECTIFNSIESYGGILKEIRENEIYGTIEVNPAYGKYHWDGHAGCDFSCSPEETKKLNGICPKCEKKLLVGVENRVEELADVEDKRESKKVFDVLPLHEVLALSYGKGMNTKSVWDFYDKLIQEFENEFNVLLVVEEGDLLKIVDEKTASLIIKNRQGKIKVKPGYDGVYGKAMLDEQKKLF